MKYTVLKDNRFKVESWKAGDIVDMDDIAAEVPLKEGAIEPYVEPVKPPVEVEKIEDEPKFVTKPLPDPKPEPKKKAKWGFLKR